MDALALLVPHLSAELRHKAFAAAMAIQDDDRRATVLSALVEQVPADERTPLIDATLDAFCSSLRPDDDVLTELAPNL